MAPTAYDRILAKRDVIENNLLRITVKVRDNPNNPMTNLSVERHEQKIEADIVDLGLIQAEILALSPETEVDDHNKKYHTLCDVADSLCNSLHGIKMNLTSQTPATPVPTASPSVTRLPQLDLKTFDGSLLEWISFRDMFDSAIHKSSSISKVQKLVYLKSLLRGEAARQIQSLVLSEANYDIAWKLLNERYQNDREILYAVFRKLFSQAPSCSSAVSLRQLVETTKECIRSMEILNLQPDKSTEAIMLYILIQRLDQSSREIWEHNLTGTSVPPLATMFEFLEQRARALAASGPIPKSKSSRGEESNVKSKPHSGEDSSRRVHAFHGKSDPRCKSCSGSFHPLLKCSKFLSMGISARYELLKKHNSCFNCLNDNHSSKTCSNVHRCRHCNQKHHSLLHSESNPESNVEQASSSQALVSTHHSTNDPSPSQGLLVTAVTEVEGKDGLHHLCRVFLDSGSTASFVSQSCVTRLGLKQKKSSVEVVGLASTSVGTAHGLVSLTFHPYFDKSVTMSVEALVIPKVTQNLPEKVFRPSDHPHLRNIKLADPAWYHPAPVDILLGSDIFWNVVGSNRISGPPGTPIGVDSKLGWLVTGNLPQPSEHRKVEVHFSTNNSLDQQLERFWKIETLPDQKLMNPSEISCEEHFAATQVRESNGSFTVSLPFKSDKIDIGHSYDIAVRRLKGVERRLAANKEHRDEYIKFMREYENLNHMTKVTYPASNPRSCFPVYIPHHFVIKIFLARRERARVS